MTNDLTLDEILDDLDDLDDMLRKREANPDFWMVTLSEKQEAKLRTIHAERCA